MRHKSYGVELRRIVRIALFGAVLLGAPSWGVAQGTNQLRDRQESLHRQILERPHDAALMLEYAQLSIELQDLEPAITTLERILIYAPDNAAARLELGVAYFRLGSYEAAGFEIERARALGLSDHDDARARQLLEEIDSRSARSRFDGQVAVGWVASTNANLGTDDRLVTFFGFPSLLPPERTAQGDHGIRATGFVRHSYDLGRPTPDTWDTDAAFYTIRFFSEDQGDIDVFRVATGPRLAVQGSAFGLTLRPYLTATYTRLDGNELYFEGGGGAEAIKPLAKDLTFFGRAEVSRRNYLDGVENFDATLFGGQLGASYRIDPSLIVRGSVIGEVEKAELDFASNFEIGARASFGFDYAHGIDSLTEIWTLSGFAQVVYREYEEPFIIADPNLTRDDLDFRIGAANLFRIAEGFGVRAEIDYLLRESNVPIFDFESLTGGVSVVYEF